MVGADMFANRFFVEFSKRAELELKIFLAAEKIYSEVEGFTKAFLVSEEKARKTNEEAVDEIFVLLTAGKFKLRIYSALGNYVAMAIEIAEETLTVDLPNEKVRLIVLGLLKKIEEKYFPVQAQA